MARRRKLSEKTRKQWKTKGNGRPAKTINTNGMKERKGKEMAWNEEKLRKREGKEKEQKRLM
jgi:hypothetical protein